MKGIKKPLREGYYAALNGHISVPVYDGQAQNQSDSAFVIIAGITDGKGGNSMSAYRTSAVIDLDICYRQKNGYSRDVVDGIEDEILQIIIPGVDTAGFSVSGFKVYNIEKISSLYIDEPGDDENMVRNILRISQTLLEQ